jgi:hypothetical protein
MAMRDFIFDNQSPSSTAIQEITPWQYLYAHPFDAIAIIIITGIEMEVNANMRVVIVVMAPCPRRIVSGRVSAGSRPH